MKVQWQLIDIKTKKGVAVGEEFELVDFMKTYFDRKEGMDWVEAIILFGNPTSIKNPVGILNCESLKKKKFKKQ
jgi:hypothetical protein